MLLLKEFERRYGRFRIDADMIADYPEVVMKLMTNMIVLRAEYLVYCNGIEYIAYCPDFEPVQQGYEIKRYSVVVTYVDIPYEEWPDGKRPIEIKLIP
jgi:hypothetical protein